MVEPIKIKTYTAVSHKIPTEQYGNVEVGSSISLEIPSDATEEEITKAMLDGKEHLQRIFKEIVEPDIQEKKLAYTKSTNIDPETQKAHVVRSMIFAAYQMEDAGKLTGLMKKLLEKSPFSKAETERIINLLKQRYNELTALGK